jgi:hypothetical protein
MSIRIVKNFDKTLLVGFSNFLILGRALHPYL